MVILLKSINNIFFIFSNARSKRFSSETLNLILSIPIASSLYELEKILQTLEQVEEPKIKGTLLLLLLFFLFFL